MTDGESFGLISCFCFFITTDSHKTWDPTENNIFAADEMTSQSLKLPVDLRPHIVSLSCRVDTADSADFELQSLRQILRCIVLTLKPRDCYQQIDSIDASRLYAGLQNSNSAVSELPSGALLFL